MCPKLCQQGQRAPRCFPAAGNKLEFPYRILSRQFIDQVVVIVVLHACIVC